MNTKKSCVHLLLFVVIASFDLLSCKNQNKADSNAQNGRIAIEQNHEWTVPLIQAYQALDENRNAASADLLFDATNNMPNKNWENYFVCATIYAHDNKADRAFDAINKAIDAGLRDTDLLNSIPEFNSLRNDSRWQSLAVRTENKQKEYLEAIENPELLEFLKQLWAADQAALSQYEESSALLDSSATVADYKRLFESVENRWNINRAKLDSIIKIHGWPGNRLVGEDGAKISWAIPQHHPDVFFKEKCLSLIKEAVEKADYDPNHYAELNDRIARETWQKQTYGASMGQDAPYPIADPAQVNQRRLELGLLEPIEVYAYYHGITYKLPTAEEAVTETNANFEEAQTNYSKFELFLTANEIDSALVSIRKSIKFYGDLNNDQLYEASLKLSRQADQRCTNLGLKIVKVLIWRRWNKRFSVIKQQYFASFNDDQWAVIEVLLNQSNQKF